MDPTEGALGPLSDLPIGLLGEYLYNTVSGMRYSNLDTLNSKICLLLAIL